MPSVAGSLNMVHNCSCAVITHPGIEVLLSFRHGLGDFNAKEGSSQGVTSHGSIEIIF
jgi:hypothetical protein